MTAQQLELAPVVPVWLHRESGEPWRPIWVRDRKGDLWMVMDVGTHGVSLFDREGIKHTSRRFDEVTLEPNP